MDFPKKIATTLPLEWSKEDLETYPWLKKTSRCYSVDEPLGEGSFGLAFAGYPLVSLNGKKKFSGSPQIVVKFPKIDLDEYKRDANRTRLDYMREKNHNEFKYLRERLRGSIHANPIIDLATFVCDGLELPVTIQPYLAGHYGLEKWLTKIRPRLDAQRRPADKKECPEWKLIEDPKEWTSVALPIARAIREIHLRRVTHSDIQPGNVFLTLDEPYTATLIDFGEGFLATPSRNWRVLNPRPYMAPERLGPRFPLNEQVDVYSFGILLLYLATGRSERFSDERHPGLHRSYIHDLIVQHNPDLVRNEPRISDLIGRSTARDPADRPRMVDIYDDLLSIADPVVAISCDPYSRESATTLERLASELQHAAGKYSPVLTRLLDQQVRELSNIFAGLQTEMVELYGTRDQMLRVMICLMGNLQSGDSWTAATTLAVWQRSALGLNGSYASANVLALKRGAAIRRTFVVSIDELGKEFSEQLAAQLCSNNNPLLKNLGKLFNAAVRRYRERAEEENYKLPTSDFVVWHRDRFVKVLQFLRDLVSQWSLSQFIYPERSIKIETSKGLHFGICPVATLDDVGAIREDNPISLMHFPHESEDARKWVLVATEVRGRNEREHGMERPYLLGVRVYKSVWERPTDRIQYLEDLMNKSSADVTSVTEALHNMVDSVQRDFK